MRTRQGAVLESLRRVQAFLDGHGALLEPVIKSTGRQVAEAIDGLTKHAVSQDGGTRGVRGETARQQALRVALRFSHMRPIAEVARLRLRQEPDFHALTMPPSNVTVPRLLAAAGAMADAAAPHLALLVENGLPGDVLVQLRAAADAVNASIAGRSSHQGTRSGATAGLIAEDRRGRTLLRVLDSLVTPYLVGNDTLRAEWRTAKQVRRKSGPPPAGSLTPVPSAAPATATPPIQLVPALEVPALTP